MRTSVVIAFFILACIGSKESKGQISFSLNLGVQPVWGPVGYYRVDYYYLPDIEAYYHVSTRRYTYLVDGEWISTYSLPRRYRNYDLYSGYKVVVNEPRPYLHNREYREKYASFRNRHDQSVIRDSRDERYFVNKNHPMHNQWKGNDEHRRENDRPRNEPQPPRGNNEHRQENKRPEPPKQNDKHENNGGGREQGRQNDKEHKPKGKD